MSIYHFKMQVVSIGGEFYQYLGFLLKIVGRSEGVQTEIVEQQYFRIQGVGERVGGGDETFL